MFLQNGFLYKRRHKHRNFISKVRVHILMATCKTWGSVDVTAHLWNAESKTTKYWQVLPNPPVFFACCVCFNICQRSEFYTKTHRGSVFAVPKNNTSLRGDSWRFVAKRRPKNKIRKKRRPARFTQLMGICCGWPPESEWNKMFFLPGPTKNPNDFWGYK